MAVTFNKIPGMKYTTMCIYIDEHMREVVNPGENPDIEARIYEYLYHIIYALSCKATYFKNFEDYDKYALYAASIIYLDMRNKLANEGKEVRGKIIVPVKSCLNFIKTLMFPLKINFQRSEFAIVFDSQLGHDTEGINSNMRESVQADYRNPLEEDYKTAIKAVPLYIKNYLKRSPFRNDPIMMNRLYISTMLSFINAITLPVKLREKLKSRETKNNFEKICIKLTNSYKANDNNIILWHLDPRFNNFIEVLVRKAKHAFSKEFNEIRSSTDLSESILDDILKTAYDNVEINGEY